MLTDKHGERMVIILSSMFDFPSHHYLTLVSTLHLQSSLLALKRKSYLNHRNGFSRLCSIDCTPLLLIALYPCISGCTYASTPLFSSDVESEFDRIVEANEEALLPENKADFANLPGAPRCVLPLINQFNFALGIFYLLI